MKRGAWWKCIGGVLLAGSLLAAFLLDYSLQIRSMLSLEEPDAAYRFRSSTLIFAAKLLLFLIGSAVLFVWDRRRMRRQGLRSKWDLERVAANIPGGICKCSLDEARTIAFLNNGFARLFGWEKQELLQKSGGSYDRLIDPADRKRVWETLSRQLREGNQAEAEYRSVNRAGEVIWLLERSERVREGSREWLYCVVVDVTALKKAEQRLRLSEERYQIALEKSSHVILEYDIPTRQLFHGKKARVLYGFPAVEEPVPERFRESGAIHPEDLDRYIRMYEAVRAGERNVSCVVRFQSVSGDYIWNKVTMTTLYDEEGHPIRAVGMMENISAEKEAREQLLQEQKYRESIKCLYTVHFEANLTRDRITLGEECWWERFQCEKESAFSILSEQIGVRLIYPGDRRQYQETVQREHLLSLYEQGETEFDMEFRCRRGDVEAYGWWLCHFHLYRDNQGDVCVLIFLKNIDEEKKEVLQLKAKAERDSLTNLYNKGTTEHLISSLLRKDPQATERHGLLVLDMDNFKSVNDTMGHQEGDMLLLEVAANLKSICRQSDIVGRIGGDEFILFLQDIQSPEVAIRKAAEVLKGFQGQHWLAHTPDVSASIGIALFPDHGRTFRELYRHADQALYTSKRRGKNTYSLYGCGNTERKNKKG